MSVDLVARSLVAAIKFLEGLGAIITLTSCCCKEAILIQHEGKSVKIEMDPKGWEINTP